MADSKKTAGNLGIQANSVVADVLAVGPNATAYKHMATNVKPEDILQAIRQLRDALSYTALSVSDKQAMTDHLDALASETARSNPTKSTVQTILKSVCETLKAGGVAIKDISELCDPIMKIAKFAAIPFHLIGL